MDSLQVSPHLTTRQRQLSTRTATYSIIDWNYWVNTDTYPEDNDPGRPSRVLMREARVAVGSGPLEDQLIRLMVWVAAKACHTQTHSGKHNPIDLLLEGSGWCDQQCELFGFLSIHILGIEKFRIISMTHCDKTSGHTVCEVFYEGDWHLFDVEIEHQAVYRSPWSDILLSYEAIRQQPNIVEKIQPHWWKGTNGTGKSGFYSQGSTYEVYDYETTYKQVWKWPWVNILSFFLISSLTLLESLNETCCFLPL